MKNKKVNGKRKGKEFENRIANLLTKKTGIKFRRPGLVAEGMGGQSDIICSDVQYNEIFIECKHHKKPITLEQLFSEKSEFNQYISETNKRADGKTWILFFKWNNSSIFGLMTRKVMDDTGVSHSAQLMAKLGVEKIMPVSEYVIGVY